LPPAHLPEAVVMVQALRKLLGKKDASFLNGTIEKALFHIWKGIGDMAVVSATGSGKTLLFALLPLLQTKSTTIVIVPYLALLENLKGRLASTPYSVATWTGTAPLSVPDLLLVSVERVNPSFIQLLQTQKIAAIFFDEAHTLITSEYRPKLKEALGLIAQVPKKLVFMTATLPPNLELQLRNLAPNLVTFRGPTMRPNLRYLVLSLPTRTEAMKRVLEEVEKTTLNNNNNKGIVFCLTVADAKELHGSLPRSSLYHGQLTPEERAASVTNFTTWMIATSGFGTGVDNPAVVKTIHFLGSHSILDLAQETGRAGREGGPADCVVVTSEQDMIRLSPNLVSWLTSKSCRRQALQQEVDGQSSSCCLSSAGVLCCDNCAAASDSLDHQDPTSLPLPPPPSPPQIVELPVVSNHVDDLNPHAPQAASEENIDDDDNYDDDQAPEPYHERHQVHQNARAEAQVTLEALLELAKKPTCIPHLLQGKHSPGSDEDCLTHKVRCFTCAANHLHCDIITPRENAQDVCFVCRLPQNVLFRLTHTSEQFGKPRACPFRSLTRSLMRLHDSHTLTFTSTLSRQQAFEFLISRDAYGLTNASTIFAKLTNKK